MRMSLKSWKSFKQKLLDNLVFPCDTKEPIKLLSIECFYKYGISLSICVNPDVLTHEIVKIYSLLKFQMLVIHNYLPWVLKADNTPLTLQKIIISIFILNENLSPEHFYSKFMIHCFLNSEISRKVRIHFFAFLLNAPLPSWFWNAFIFEYQLRRCAQNSLTTIQWKNMTFSSVTDTIVICRMN